MSRCRCARRRPAGPSPRRTAAPGFDTTGGRSYTLGVRHQIFEAFAEAVRQVCHDTDLIVDSVEPGDAFGSDAQVITSVGITGDLRGIFMLRTDMEGAAGILKAMTGGIRLTIANERLTEIQLAAIGEFANQVAGRAVTLLTDLGVVCDITPPAVLAAPQLQSLGPDLAETFRQTVNGSFGRITIFLGFQHREDADPLQKTS